MDSVVAAAPFSVNLAVTTAGGLSQHAYSCYNLVVGLSLDYVAEIEKHYVVLAAAAVEIVLD